MLIHSVVFSFITHPLFHCFTIFLLSPSSFGIAPLSPPSWLFSLVSAYFLPHYLNTCKLDMLMMRKQFFKLVKMCHVKHDEFFYFWIPHDFNHPKSAIQEVTAWGPNSFSIKFFVFLLMVCECMCVCTRVCVFCVHQVVREFGHYLTHQMALSPCVCQHWGGWGGWDREDKKNGWRLVSGVRLGLGYLVDESTKAWLEVKQEALAALW